MDEERERDGERCVDSDESKQVTLMVNAKMVVHVVPVSTGSLYIHVW